MTKKFVVDASAVLHLAGKGITLSGRYKLLAPTLLRSQTLSALHEAVQRGEIPEISLAAISLFL